MDYLLQGIKSNFIIPFRSDKYCKLLYRNSLRYI